MASVAVTGAREAAFAALQSCEKQGAWSDQAIKNESKRFGLSPRDAALAANLCYGVVQNQLLLDFWIDHFSKTPAKQLDVPVRLSLRLGLYQLHFLDRVPASAAVNESVNLVRKCTRNKGAAGLTNAVLRAFERAEKPPMPQSLAILHSHPQSLVELLEGELGGSAEELLALNNTPADLLIQVNTTKTKTADLVAMLEQEGVSVRPHPWLDDCLIVTKTGDMELLESFKQGLFYVQDSAAKLAALVAEAKPGDTVLDLCAAPGGKSFACGVAMEGKGEILARDLHENKLKRIRSGAKRLGLDCITAKAADARQEQPELFEQFRIVLADVPCSGLGIIRKKPDIRYKDLKALEDLPEIQRDILQNAAQFVQPGGVLIYSTCTVLRRENQAVVEAFLKANGNFVLERFALPEPIGQTDGQITLWPHIHGTDGFFIAKLRKTHG